MNQPEVTLKTNRSNRVNTIRHTRSGYEFDLKNKVWMLEKGVKVNVGKVTNLLNKDIRNEYVNVLSHFAQKYSPGHTCTINERLHHLLQTTKSDRINAQMLINYKSTLTEHTAWYMGSIRALVRKWGQLGAPGLGQECKDYLYGLRIKGSIKGDAVKRRDVHVGPLTDNELQAFNESCARAFESDQINIAELAMGLLCSSTGRRPRQIAHLKLKDLLGEMKRKSGEPVYLVRFPRAKQRNESFRSSFKDFALTSRIWQILVEQKRHVMNLANTAVGTEIKPEIQECLPLFPDINRMQKMRTIHELIALIDSDRLHIDVDQISKTLKHVAKKTECRSERTGKVINIIATRFRRTLGTRAAREGHGPMVIAELLDHSDMQNSHIYTENVPENVGILDRTLGFQLAPYAQAFQGRLIESERDADRGNDPASRIRHEGRGAGNCGAYAHCGGNVPIPCYTCMHFQAWVFGPHNEVYEQLLRERERIFKITKDELVAASNDRTILAVARVIQLCELRKNKINNT